MHLSRRRFAAAATLAATAAAANAPAASARAAAPSGYTVVELFTSVLCPGCPAADAFLIELARRDALIPLSFSVTHYDRGDLKDPFGRAEFSRRQFGYAQAFHRDTAFTPEVVVNGKADAPGLATGFVEELLVGAQLDGPIITPLQGAVAVAEGAAPAAPADVWVAHYDPRVIQVPIRGLADRSIPQVNVVRGLYRLGEWTGRAARYDAPPLEPGLKRAVVVQSADTGPILAATRG